MNRPTLDAFIRSASTGARKNAYVLHPGFKHLYVRHTQRCIRGDIASPVLDLANLEARNPGNGAFTKLFHHLRKKYPEYWLFAECVLNDRFEKKLLELGFTQVGEGPCPSFYLPPVKGDL